MVNRTIKIKFFTHLTYKGYNLYKGPFFRSKAVLESFLINSSIPDSLSSEGMPLQSLNSISTSLFSMTQQGIPSLSIILENST